MKEALLAEFVRQLSCVNTSYDKLGPLADLRKELPSFEHIDDLGQVSALLNQSRAVQERMLKIFDQPKCEYDDLVLSFYELLLSMSHSDRREAADLLSEADSAALSPYYWRSHFLSIDENSSHRLLSGLSIYAFRARDNEDYRDVMCELAPSHICAEQLSLDVKSLFNYASEFAGPNIASLMCTFGERTDVTAQAFGWHLAATPHGPRFRQA